MIGSVADFRWNLVIHSACAWHRNKVAAAFADNDTFTPAGMRCHKLPNWQRVKKLVGDDQQGSGFGKRINAVMVHRIRHVAQLHAAQGFASFNKMNRWRKTEFCSCAQHISHQAAPAWP